MKTEPAKTDPRTTDRAAPPRRAARNTAGPRAQAPADSVVCFAGTDWWYHPRGHSECQLMQRIARERTVLWVNSIGMRAPKRGATQRPLNRYLRKIKSTLRLLRRDPSGMWVFSPIFVPRYTERAVRLNGVLLRAQIAVVRRLLGMRRPSAFVTLPTAAHAATGAGYARVVFNRADDYKQFPEADTELIDALERRLIASADTTLYVNRDLMRRERTRAANPVLLGHGVDFEHFARDRHEYAREHVPALLRNITGPIIGFYGGLEPYTVDLDLLVATARRFRNATLAIIGPRSMNTERLAREPNVIMLDPIPYADLPAAAASFDAALMPWVQNEWIRACNPIKLKEYLALGVPIASTPFPALEPFAQLVETGATREAFLDAVARVLEDRDPSRRAARRAAVSHDSWDALGERVAIALGVRARPSIRAQAEPKPVTHDHAGHAGQPRRAA